MGLADGLVTIRFWVQFSQLILRSFNVKNFLPSSGFKPTTVWLTRSCLGITFFLGICTSMIDRYAPICSRSSGGPWSCPKNIRAQEASLRACKSNRVGVKLLLLETLSTWSFFYGSWTFLTRLPDWTSTPRPSLGAMPVSRAAFKKWSWAPRSCSPTRTSGPEPTRCCTSTSPSPSGKLTFAISFVVLELLAEDFATTGFAECSFLLDVFDQSSRHCPQITSTWKISGSRGPWRLLKSAWLLIVRPFKKVILPCYQDKNLVSGITNVLWWFYFM